MPFKDRVAIVTGGGRGIGAATVRRFAQDGAAVAIAACRPEEQEQTGFCRIDTERVRDIARAVHERASHRFDHGLSMLDADLAGEDHEELVLRSVDVEW
jgi:NAD(P)-dependent dehydrogenase (short-subunit alcohol dehydrogenase family)